MPGDVQCKNCGLLALRVKNGGGLDPIDFGVRNGERLPHNTFSNQFGSFSVSIHHDEPVCSVLAYDLPAECVHSKFLDVLNADRTCDQFVPWQPTLSPKDHVEMKLLHEVETRTKLWQQQQEALAETRHQELRKDATRDSDWSRILALGSLIAAIVAAIAAVGSALAAWLATRNH